MLKMFLVMAGAPSAEAALAAAEPAAEGRSAGGQAVRAEPW